MAEDRKLKTPLNGKPCTIGDLELDLLIQEDEELSNKVTQFPVEDKSPANDHVINEPGILTIVGFVTNAPIRAHGGTQDNKARVTVNGDQLTGEEINFADLALAYLRKIRLDRLPIKVTTRRGTWENMIVQRFSRTKTKDTGDALLFTITLIEFRQVTLRFVAAPKRTKSGRAQPRSDQGKKDKQKKEDSKSIPYKLEHGIIDTWTMFTK